MSAPLCRKCWTPMGPGKAVAQTYGGIPDFPGTNNCVTISPCGPGVLTECFKCPQCGHSITATAQQLSEATTESITKENQMITPFYVTSSNINCLGYDIFAAALYIRFNSGETYLYAEVPFSVFDALLCAESVGQTFHRTVKNKYAFTKLIASPFDEVRKVEPIEEAPVAA